MGEVFAPKSAHGDAGGRLGTEGEGFFDKSAASTTNGRLRLVVIRVVDNNMATIELRRGRR